MNESGSQCLGEAMDPTDFCDAHQNVVAFERLEEPGWRKTILRFVALVLLIMFLVPFLYTLRNLYYGPPARAQEVW